MVLRIASFVREMGFVIKGLTYSPIRGPEGNIEYLIYIKKPDGNSTDEADITVNEDTVLKLVNESHEVL